jgi:hypothetical protein
VEESNQVEAHNSRLIHGLDKKSQEKHKKNGVQSIEGIDTNQSIF